MSYTYDAWARLKTALTTGSTQYHQWGLSWDYDRFGNRKNQNVTAGSAPAPQLTISPTTNRVTQVGSTNTTHDAGGNLTNDTFYKYTYDAESRIKEVKTQAGGLLATYTYDGAGLRACPERSRRMKKVAGATTTRYIFSGSKVIAEYDNGAAVTAPTREYLYAGSQLLATHTGAGGATVTYELRDHLSTRVFTNSSGNWAGDRGHYPFGEVWYESGSTHKWKFTSYERDNESGLDYAMFRYDSSRLGRFLTPDPLAGSLRNPQSLNRYAYVRNDPVNLIDPLGLTCFPGEDCYCFGSEVCFPYPTGPATAPDPRTDHCTFLGPSNYCSFETPKIPAEVFNACKKEVFGDDSGFSPEAYEAIRKVAAETGVDSSLLAGVWGVESGFRLRPPSGDSGLAIGPLQLWPAVRAGYTNPGENPGATEKAAKQPFRGNPQDNINAASRFLTHLVDRYDTNDPFQVAQAYHLGEKRYGQGERAPSYGRAVAEFSNKFRRFEACVTRRLKEQGGP